MNRAHPWHRLFWLLLHLILVIGAVWGLTSWLGGIQGNRGGGSADPGLAFSFLQEGDFWIQTFWAMVETLAIAVLATALGALVGTVFGMLATRSGLKRDRGMLATSALFVARLLLDLMRAIPDFGWALLLLTVLGAGPVTGVLALAISNAGILGRLYSEQWETLDGSARALASTGQDSRLVRFFYVHRRAFDATNRSFTMLRLECTVRNASVIGVVGGGGLGGQIFEAFSLGQRERAIVLFLALCALAGWTESSSGRVLEAMAAKGRNLLTLVALLGSMALLWPAFQNTKARLHRTDFDWVLGTLAKFFAPDLGWEMMLSLAKSCLLPVILAYLSTILALVFAFALAFPLAKHRQSRWGWQRKGTPLVASLLGAAAWSGRWVSLVARTLPVEAAVLIFAFAWGLGWQAALAALTLHSASLLLRLFYDLLDRHPSHELEHRGAMRRMDWWTYVVTPQLWPRWRSFVFFLGDANLRSGIVLGMIGVGGIGDRFHTSLSFWQLGTASSCLLWMLLLSMLSDRAARYVARRSKRCLRP